MVTRESTFQIKTLNPECTCSLTVQSSPVILAYMANRHLEDSSRNPDWEVLGVHHHVMQQISVDLSLSQVYKSRKTTRGLIIGNEEQQYSLMYRSLLCRGHNISFVKISIHLVVVTIFSKLLSYQFFTSQNKI